MSSRILAAAGKSHPHDPVIPYGITGVDPSGTIDDSVAFQAFIDSVPDNATIDLNPTRAANVFYRTESPIVVDGRKNLKIQWNGATFTPKDAYPGVTWAQFFYDFRNNGHNPPIPPGQHRYIGQPGTNPPNPTPNTTLTKNQLDAIRGRCQWIVTGDSQNILFDHPRIVGANTTGGYDSDLEAQHGFYLNDCVGVTIDTPLIWRLYGDAINLGALGGNTHQVLYTWIHHADIRQCGRDAVALTKCTFTVIEDCTYLGSLGRSTFDIEPLANALPATADRKVEWTWIRRNKLYGQQLANSVACHGGGAVNHFWYQFNEHIGHPMQIDVYDEQNDIKQSTNPSHTPYATDQYGKWYRSDFHITDNWDTNALTNTHAILLRCVDGAEVTRNAKAFNAGGGQWRLVKATNCCGLAVSGNPITGAAGELLTVGACIAH